MSSDKKLHNHILETLEKTKKALNEYSGYTSCRKCGKEIKKSEANKVPIADSPDDYLIEPYCDSCYKDTMGVDPEDYSGSQAQLERDLKLALRDYAEEYGDYNAVIQVMKVIPNLTHIAESIEKSYGQ